MQCVAVCCSVLQCAAVCCSVLQCVAVCCSVLQCVPVCCIVTKLVTFVTRCNTPHNNQYKSHHPYPLSGHPAVRDRYFGTRHTQHHTNTDPLWLHPKVRGIYYFVTRHNTPHSNQYKRHLTNPFFYFELRRPNVHNKYFVTRRNRYLTNTHPAMIAPESSWHILCDKTQHTPQQPTQQTKHKPTIRAPDSAYHVVMRGAYTWWQDAIHTTRPHATYTPSQGTRKCVTCTSWQDALSTTPTQASY